MAVTPFAFCASTNFGITQLVIHSAEVAFLPPAIALAAMVSVMFLASAFFFGSESEDLPRQPLAPVARTRSPASTRSRRGRGLVRRMNSLHERAG